MFSFQDWFLVAVGLDNQRAFKNPYPIGTIESPCVKFERDSDTSCIQENLTYVGVFGIVAVYFEFCRA